MVKIRTKKKLGQHFLNNEEISKKIPLKFGTLLGCAFLTGGGLVINKFMKLNRNKIIDI